MCYRRGAPGQFSKLVEGLMCFNQIVAIHFHFVPLCALIKVFPGKNGSYINNILKGTMSRPEFPNIFHSSYKKMSLKVTPLTRT